jgi:hypothetical protein
MRYHEIMTETVLAESSLRTIQINDIDLDAAARHFDLPIEGQVAGSMRRALSATKAGLVRLFKGQTHIRIYRGLDVSVDELNVVNLGIAWAWGEEGAIKGSGIGSSNQTGIILTGEVAEPDVDWGSTIAVNTFHEEEQEIVLQHGVQVKILSIHNLTGHSIGANVTPETLRNYVTNA